MKRIKIVGLCVAALFVVGAVAAAAGAFAAEPALYECAKAVKNTKTKKYEGKYEKGCTEENAEGEGKYELQEWNPEDKNKVTVFKGAGKGFSFYVAGFADWTCTSSADEGEWTSPKTAGKVKITLKGCEVDTEKFRSKGAAAGEIKLNPLVGELGYINKAKSEVGLDLKPESGVYLAEFEWGATPVNLVIKGSIIGQIEPINKFSKETRLVYEREGTTQEPTKFEGGLQDTLIAELCSGCNPIGAGEKETGVLGGFTNKGEELEIKA